MPEKQMFWYITLNNARNTCYIEYDKKVSNKTKDVFNRDLFQVERRYNVSYLLLEKAHFLLSNSDLGTN